MSFALFSSNIESRSSTQAGAADKKSSLAKVALEPSPMVELLNVRTFSALRLRSRRALSSYSCRLTLAKSPRLSNLAYKRPLQPQISSP